ncbi:hypothetical protein EYB45_08900 [Erythrobacteraceae bacterium CFH 75059]|uniref:TrbC/VirB2 family protein n=1 Tax=Qipengyuania thermophila TaxID=2509361 RepID=UPI001020636C|nr:TrbC/VirB2 family protein [Qipengyuania thermophila]TCD04344.1 hypothetical protein EYB45_08900 [Erythrobacteraceae bacterium CFH 75059]
MYSPFAAREPEPLQASAGWLTATLLGELAVGLCIIAVAVIGLSMLSGRLPLWRGAAVILGCFVLLGAPAIAAAFLAMGETARGSGVLSAERGVSSAAAREALAPSTYDPYAGASLRDDR